MSLVAVSNSEQTEFYLRNKCSVMRGAAHEMRKTYVETIPIPDMRGEDRQALSKLAQLCLDAIGQGCEAYEREINERVTALYGL